MNEADAKAALENSLPNWFVRRVLDLGRSPYQKLKTPSDVEWQRRCAHEKNARGNAGRN
jgi:hypothetical protein